MRREYKDLIVWQKAMDLVVAIYQITEQFPKEEKFGLASQMNRAVISIPSNIAEGKMRGYEKDCQRFFTTAFGSGGELETQIEAAKRIPKIQNIDFSEADELLDEVMKMLNKFIHSSS